MKIGKRIQIIKDYGAKHLKGLKGTIKDIKGRSYLVEFDEFMEGHDGLDTNNKGRWGYCWWVENEHIKKRLHKDLFGEKI